MFFEDEEKDIHNLHDKGTLSVSFLASLIGTKVRHNNYGDALLGSPYRPDSCCLSTHLPDIQMIIINYRSSHGFRQSR
jgi:NADPH-dependent 7-cyano-7-deazaguanine reductase QueF